MWKIVAEAYQGHRSSDEEHGDENEADAVDNCSGQHPVVHQLLIVSVIMTLSVHRTHSRLEQVTDVFQQTLRHAHQWFGCHQ